MPLGLIVWLILIFIIACGACPGFITYIVTLLSVFLAGCLLGLLLDYFRDRDKTPGEPHSRPHAYTKSEREKIIDQWEQKWGRTHPSRINK